MQVKICGVTRVEDALLAATSGADAIGLVLTQSRRRVTLDDARVITAGLPPFISRVAVMRDPTAEELAGVARSGIFTHVQLHGSETPQLCRAAGLPVIKAFPLLTTPDLERLLEFLAECPGVVPLADADEGGSGQRCSWELAAEAASRLPLVLAGGLTPENVAEAIARVQPAAVDVSSGVESRPGEKDPLRVRAFIEAARGQGVGCRL